MFLRAYNHKNFLNFQLDQARDAIIAENFVSHGINNAPLLGPHVTGGELKIGPIFYYIQAIPVFFFGAFPNVLALPDLLFSILFIPVFYYFLRLYFPLNISLAVCAISAVSLYLIIFGRFAWNPNSLPLFTLLTLLGLLKTNWKNKIRPNWFYLAVVSAAIAMQLHLIYFFIGPVFIITFLLLWKPGLKIKNYLISLSIVLLLYSPVIFSEIKNGETNSNIFVKNIVETIINNDKHNILEKAFHSYQGIQKIYWGIITSNESGEDVSTRGFHIACNRKCKDALPLFALQTIFFLLSIATGLYAYRREKDQDRQKFIASTFLWLSVSFLIFLPLSYKFYSRYYLSIIPPLLTLLAIFLNELQNTAKGYGRTIAAFLAIAFIFSGLRNDRIYLEEHRSMAEKEMENTIGRSFFDDEKITLEQLERATSYISENNTPSSPLRVVVDNKYARSMFYLLQYQNNIPSCYIKWSAFHPSYDQNYFLVLILNSSQELSPDMKSRFEIKSQKKIGNLLLIDMRSRDGNSSMTDSDNQEICYTS